jgi:hypothetical protein
MKKYLLINLMLLGSVPTLTYAQAPTADSITTASDTVDPGTAFSIYYWTSNTNDAFIDIREGSGGNWQNVSFPAQPQPQGSMHFPMGIIQDTEFGLKVHKLGYPNSYYYKTIYVRQQLGMSLVHKPAPDALEVQLYDLSTGRAPIRYAVLQGELILKHDVTPGAYYIVARNKKTQQRVISGKLFLP